MFQVYFLSSVDLAGDPVPPDHHPESQDARLPPLHPLPAHPSRGHQHNREKVLRRRLVPVLHARPERGLDDFQGGDARAGAEVGPPRQGLHGHVSSDPHCVGGDGYSHDACNNIVVNISI